MLSALGRLVSERNNNLFSSVNLPLWGLYHIQLRLCQICTECKAFDCCKLQCYRYIDKFLLVFVSPKEGQTTSRPFYFNINRPISDLIFLRRCIKFNPPIRVRLVLIGLWATQSNCRLNFNRGLEYLIEDSRKSGFWTTRPRSVDEWVSDECHTNQIGATINNPSNCHLLKCPCDQKNHFLFFLRFWKCVCLTLDWQNSDLSFLSKGCLLWV